jgi:hypothetical protein
LLKRTIHKRQLTERVVDAAGQPTPGPFRFWIVTKAASIRAAFDAFELSVGNETDTEGLWTAWPAATFASSAEMYTSCDGGHEHGTLIGWPLEPFTAPSQSPVPVGFTPLEKPSGGASAATELDAAEELDAAGVDAGAAAGAAAAALLVPAWIACCCATNVVDEAGQPTPGPFRF